MPVEIASSASSMSRCVNKADAHNAQRWTGEAISVMLNWLATPVNFDVFVNKKKSVALLAIQEALKVQLDVNKTTVQICNKLTYMQTLYKKARRAFQDTGFGIEEGDTNQTLAGS